MPKTTIKFIPGNRAGIMVDPNKAGIIEIRPGIKGLDLGEQKYAGAFIRVLDEHHYLNGMCVYSDRLPESYDVIKYCYEPKDCLKALKDDRDDSKDRNMPQKFNKGVMTRYKDTEAWAALKAWKEAMDPSKLATQFLDKRRENRIVIKNCPWCGGSASLHTDGLEGPRGTGYPGRFKYYVKCDTCGAIAPNGETYDIYGSPETEKRAAIEIWNKRKEK